MTRPVHTIKYMRASYRRYQILAIAFALVTIIASLLAALTGIQHASLIKAKEKAALDTPPKVEVVPDPEVVKELEHTKGLLAKTQQQLAAEKQNTARIQERAEWLSRQLAAEKAKTKEILPQDQSPDTMEHPQTDSPPPATEPALPDTPASEPPSGQEDQPATIKPQSAPGPQAPVQPAQTQTTTASDNSPESLPAVTPGTTASSPNDGVPVKENSLSEETLPPASKN